MKLIKLKEIQKQILNSELIQDITPFGYEWALYLNGLKLIINEVKRK